MLPVRHGKAGGPQAWPTPPCRATAPGGSGGAASSFGVQPGDIASAEAGGSDDEFGVQPGRFGSERTHIKWKDDFVHTALSQQKRIEGLCWRVCNNYEQIPVLKLPLRGLALMPWDVLRPFILTTVTQGMGYKTAFVHVATSKNACFKLMQGQRTERHYEQRRMVSVDMSAFDQTCYIDLSTPEAQLTWFREYPDDSDEVRMMLRDARSLAARVKEVLICCPVPQEAVLETDPHDASAAISYP